MGVQRDCLSGGKGVAGVVCQGGGPGRGYPYRIGGDV